GLFFSKEASPGTTVTAEAILTKVMNATELRLAIAPKKLNARRDDEELFKSLKCAEVLVDLFTQDFSSRRTKLQLMQVARTLADLANSEIVTRAHFEEAFRLVQGNRKDLLKSPES